MEIKEEKVTKFYCRKCKIELEFQSRKNLNTAGVLLSCIAGCLGGSGGPRVTNTVDECVTCGEIKV